MKCGMLADGHEPVGTNKNLWNNHGWPVRCALLAWLLWPPRLCKCKCNVYLVVVPRPRGGRTGHADRGSGVSATVRE